MKKVGGAGLFLAGIILIFLGVVLRTNILDWLIDATGFLLIVIGIVAGIAGLVGMMSGGGKSSSNDW